MNKVAKNKQRTLRKQIQVAIVSISVVAMFILGICFYVISTRNIEKNYVDDFYYNLKTSDNIVDIQFGNIIELMRNLLSNSEYMNTLGNTNTENMYFTSWQNRVLENASSKITLQSEMVQEVLSISEDGKLYIHSKRSDISEYAQMYAKKSIIDEAWAVKAKEAGGKEIIFGKNVLTEEENTMSIVKCMINTTDGDIVGYVIVNVYKKMFDKAFDNRGNYETNCFLLIDTSEENQCIYYQGNETEQQKIYAQYVGQSEESNYVICERNSSIDHWVMICGISKNELNKQRHEMGFLILGLTSILLLVSIVVSNRISNKIYAPLRTLEMTMQQVEEGNRHITENFDDSEVGLLGRKFKELVNNNLVLRERLLYAKIRQREQELHLLQEQINPHFLYNTLDALYCMAEIYGVDDIAKMVEALSETFRLSLNKGSNIILVEDEIKHIKAYMVIQNMRFQNRFQLEIDADEVMDVKIMNLLLEPFVENAVVHGLEPKIGVGKISVMGRKEKTGDVIFTICDDGIGVADLSKLEKGYGIRNVKERIQLYYGEDYGVTFESQENMGTKVTVKISEKRKGVLAENEKNCDY